MTCGEFQKALPYIIDSGGDPEHQEHLRSCPVCSDLVADLKYIAEQAKLLVPMEDPPARVWDGIKGSLEKEGMLSRPTGPRGRLLKFPWTGPAPWLALPLVLVLAIVGMNLYKRGAANSSDERSAPAPPATATYLPNADDRQILTAVNGSLPALRETFEESLRAVNSYISDAKRHAEANPTDPDAQQALMQAYHQKAMLYQMALSHSVQ